MNKKPFKLNISSPGGCHKSSACRTRIVVLPGSALPAGAGDEARKPCGHSVTEKSCCRNHMVVLPGYGQEAFPFPTVETIVTKAGARLTKAAQAARKARAKGKSEAESESSGEPVDLVRRLSLIPGVTGASRPPRRGLASQLPGAPLPGSSSDQTLRAAAEGLRVIFHRGRFEAIIAEKFDPLTGAVNWAKHNMPAKYQPAIESLHQHLTKLQDLYREALPRVMDLLAAQHPDAPKEALLAAAVQVIDEQLAEILFVLRIWTDAFGQLRDGQYEQLQA